MDWIGENLWQTWLLAAVGLAVVELVSLDLIFIMLAIGCHVGMLPALHTVPDELTLVLAMGTALAMIP